LSQSSHEQAKEEVKEGNERDGKSRVRVEGCRLVDEMAQGGRDCAVACASWLVEKVF
jgi:hypothetical protein